MFFLLLKGRVIVLGKILSDETPVSEYNIDEKKFVVVMVSKPKSVSAPSEATAPPTTPPHDKGDTNPPQQSAFT